MFPVLVKGTDKKKSEKKERKERRGKKVVYR